MKKIIFIFFTVLLTGAVFGQTKTEIKVSDLPKSIPDFISKNMNGFTIDKAFKVVDKGVQTYDVLIKNGDKKHVMAFDKDGNFLKKIDNKETKDALQKTGDPGKNIAPAVTKPAVPAATSPTIAQPKKK